MRFYVVGGEPRAGALSKEEWRRYQRGLVLEVDSERRTVERRVAYASPPEALPSMEDPSILFKAASQVGDRLYACTTTEVLVYRLPSFELETYLSLPAFNDVHHVRPTAEGTLLVANTGLDMVMEVRPSGERVREWSAVGGDPWERFDPAIDYRQVPSTKPHAAHPNYVFEADGSRWVTRFEQRDALCLDIPERRLPIDLERPHDGIVHPGDGGDRVSFTTVDGRVVQIDARSGRTVRAVDLNHVVDTPYALGWCRGLAVLDEDRVVVGFSRLRPTAFRQNVRWVKHRLGLRTTPGNLPARIAAFDLSAERLLWEIELEAAGLATVFSIHRAEGAC